MSGFSDLLREGRLAPTVMLQMGIAMHAMDAFLVATIMPSVVADIGGVRFYAWVSMLYMVGSIMGSASAAAVRVGLGPRRAVLVAGGLFLVGSLGCSVAPAMPALLATRLVQGLGGGLIVALAMALIGELYPPGLRKRMLAGTSTVWAAAALMGPALGGLAAEVGWWRAAFAINVPAITAFLWLAVSCLPDVRLRGAHPAFPLGRVALFGLGVLAVAGAGLMRTLPPAAGLMGLALLAVGATLWRDARAPRRILPAAALTLRSGVGTACLMLTLISLTHVMVGVFMPLLMQKVYGLRPLYAGYFGSILALGWTFASLATSGWQGRRERIALRGGPLLMAAAVGALLAGHGRLPPAAVAMCMAVLGLGIGSLSLHLIARAMQLAAPGEETATAAAIPLVRGLGMAFGAALAGAVATYGGLREALAPAAVTQALSAVYGVTLIAPLGLIALSVWLLRLPAVRATPVTEPAVPGIPGPGPGN